MAASLPVQNKPSQLGVASTDPKTLNCPPSDACPSGKKKKNKRKKDDVEQEGEHGAAVTGITQQTSEHGEQPKKKKKHKKKHSEGGGVDQALKSVPSAKEDGLAKVTDSKTKEASQTVTLSDEKKEGTLKKKKRKQKTIQPDSCPAPAPITSSQQPLTLESSKPKATTSTCPKANEAASISPVPTAKGAPEAAAESSKVVAPAPVTEAVKADAAPRTGEPDGLSKKKKKKDKKDKNLKKDSEAPRAKAHEPVPLSLPTSTPSHPAVSKVDIQNFFSSNKITYEPPEIASEFPPVLNFDSVNVNNALRRAFTTFKNPSPIQSAVWPVLMAGRDVVGIAETGSGKTLAFGVPALEHVINKPKPSNDSSSINVLVIAPTRELAMQTEATLSELGKLVSPPIKSLCVYGGVDKGSQRKALARAGGVRVVAGTPGRLLDLANEGHLKLDQVSWLVLDEADRMLDKGFENDIRAIIGLCLPSRAQNAAQTRLTAMFSATWPLSVRRLAADFMRDPVRILVGEDELTASCSVEQTVQVLDDSRGKEWKLLNTLNDLYKEKSNSKKNKNEAGTKDKMIVFALYKKEAQRLHQFLLRKGFEACCIEGDMSQDKRSQSLEDFKSGKASILVATDVAARGLDIPKVEVVINVTFPLTIEDYIHRIGRTGRAGRTGKSITFFTDEDKAHAGELMRVLKEAGQTVPEDLKQWGGQIKKKTHAAYGDHWKDIDPTVKATKIKFD